MEAGLHVTMYSILKHSSRKDSGVKFHLFLEGFSEADKTVLRATLDKAQTAYDLHFHSVELDVFKGFRSLQGNYMTYARLLLADMLKDEGKFLYLDSDLVVSLDIHDLFHADLQGYPVGAVVAGGTIDWALERSFFLQLGLDKNAAYFNAGVLLFNATCWREENLTQECLDFCSRHPFELRAADQTVLNYILQKRVANINDCYNVPCYATGKRISEDMASGQITHFVGSPKPWDLFGSVLHPSYRLFKSYFDETALRRRIRFQSGLLFRSIALRRSYFRSIRSKFKS